MFKTISIAVVAFASTNIDDIFVLLGFFADSKLKRWHVVWGQYLGIIALVVASFFCSLLTLAVPDRYVGLLGVFPILIGLWHLWTAWCSRSASHINRKQVGASAIILVAAVTIANGGDNIAVYVPLFSRQSSMGLMNICIVFAIMTAIWCALGAALLGHPKLGASIRQWGGRIMPLVLVGLGIYILISSGAVTL